MQRRRIELLAQPGAKYAKEEFGEVVVNVTAVAGSGRQAFVGLDGALVEMPNMPIASFYGPCAKHDAQLFAAATAVMDGVQFLERMLGVVVASIDVFNTGDTPKLADDPEIKHAMLFARLVQYFASGVEVVRVIGATAISAENPEGEPVDEWLPIRQAIGLAEFGRGSVRYAAIELPETDAKASGDDGDKPEIEGNTVGDAMTPVEPDPLGEEQDIIPDPGPDADDQPAAHVKGSPL